jgi:hypothetical protein
MMRIPAPETRDYKDLLRFIRADGVINEKCHKLISALTEEISSQFAEQGKNFDLEFAHWQAERYECMYIDLDGLMENGAYVCDNCGAYSELVHDIYHYPTCRSGEFKRWKEIYSNDNEEEVMQYVGIISEKLLA